MRHTLRRPLVILVMVLIGTVCLGWFTFTRDRSIYAPGFSEEHFAQVSPGMKTASVVTLVGKPLSEDDSGSPEIWSFGGEGKRKGLHVEFSGGSSIAFDSRGNVTEVRGELASRIRSGMNQAEVLRVAGPPTDQRPSWSRRFDYSKPSSSGRYRARIVLFSESGEVIRTITHDSYD